MLRYTRQGGIASTRVARQISRSMPAQTGEHDRHDQPGLVPNPGEHQGVDRAVGPGDPVEHEVVPAEPAHEVLNADRRAQHPLPGQAGDDERDRQRVKKDRAKGAFEAHLPVEQHGEQHPEPERAQDIEHAKEEHVAPGDIPARRGEQPDILDEAGELVIGQQCRAGDRQIRGPDRAPVEAHQHHQHGRRQHRLGRQITDAHDPRADHACVPRPPPVQPGAGSLGAPQDEAGL